MDQGTPRLRSAFPSTPQTNRRSTANRFDGSDSFARRSAPIPTLQTLKPSPSQPSDPLIPEHILDAPTQRLFTASIFVLLWAYRIWDWVTLNDLEEQSLWLFMKWVAIDGVFLFGLPGLRIPWLEWSPSTMTLLFCIHAFVDGMLMFRIPIPIGAGLSAVGRSVYGAYEMAVNEHTVNPETVRFNESLILGRQVVHILPEGSAILNPEKQAFCIDGSRPEVELPITINATEPIAMDLIRVDLEKDYNETIHITKGQIKSMHNHAKRLLTYNEDPNKEKTLYYTVKKPGLYVLAKVVDKSNLEVARKRLAHTVVAHCPRAAVKPAPANRCRGELSNVEFEVTGAPPLSIKYHKIINRVVNEGTIENILPSDDFSSPLARGGQSSLVIPAKMEKTWAQSQPASISVSESLSSSGQWAYYIDEVRDAFGNPTKYSSREHEDQQKYGSKTPPLRQAITVHERPTVNLRGCSPQSPLKEAKGKPARLPMQFGSAGVGSKAEIPAAPYHLEVLFSPQNDITAVGEHVKTAQKLRLDVKNAKEPPLIKEPGLYSIAGISTEFCEGEVLEPASCVLQNPPQPELSIRSEEVFDKCAGSPVGLRVDLDLIGTPPFEVTYRVKRKSERHYTDAKPITIPGLRGQIDLTPSVADHYTYEFVKISDHVYSEQKLSGLRLEQDVKPSASAHFFRANEKKGSCIDEAVRFPVALQGEGPFALEYELVHNGKRAKFSHENITSDVFEIETERLMDGGDYTLALASVTDRMGCQEFLKNQVTISVRPQKPKVAFRTIDGKRSVSALEGKQVQLPLRLEGDAPWRVKYTDPYGKMQTVTMQSANDKISVSGAGRYELVDVSDTCPGVVDETAQSFEVSWIARPEMRIRAEDVAEQKSGAFVKRDVCENDDDTVELLFQGSPAFVAVYTQNAKLDKGAMAPKTKEIRATSHMSALRMDTHQAGLYTYQFSKLSDANYNTPTNFKPITLQQRVNQRPSAAFTNPGKTYSFCSVESDGEEVIPITLHGEPPFDLEVEIKHHGTARPETVSLTHITTKTHNIRIPHSRLHLGKSAVTLRRVSDGRGCARILDGSRVQISVHDAPTLTELESHADFCVGDRINFALSGTAPFNVFYNFEGASRKAVSGGTKFTRFAEHPGDFTITGLSDSASTCKSAVHLTKHIRSLPSVRVSHGKEGYVDIHEGGEAEILFEFTGVPPFEFTYTRSSNTERNGRKPGTVLDMRSEVSEGYSMTVKATEAGTYEVVSIKDWYCGYTRPGAVAAGGTQKRLKY